MVSLHSAPELAAYQDEPAQMPSGAPGKDAYLRLVFAPGDQRSELVKLSRRAPLLVQQALHWDEGMPELACVIVISTSGGMLQGDRHAIEIDLEPGACAHITTQSATKIQEMDANYAAQTQHITAHEGSYLEYLPEPIIPYRHSRFIAETVITAHPSSTVLFGEILAPGRAHHRNGEIFEYDLFSSTLRGERPDGEELFVEKFLIEPHRLDVNRRGVMGGFHTLANAVLLAPPQVCERVLAQTTAQVDTDRQLATGTGRLPNEAGLVFWALAMESEPIRAQVREFWSLVRHHAVDREVTPAFRWR